MAAGGCTAISSPATCCASRESTHGPSWTSVVLHAQVRRSASWPCKHSNFRHLIIAIYMTYIYIYTRRWGGGHVNVNVNVNNLHVAHCFYPWKRV